MKIYLIFFAILLTTCRTQRNQPLVLCVDNANPFNVTKVTFNDLYTSKNLEGKTINIEGRFSYNFEDIALYPSKSDAKGIWLAFDSKILQQDSLLVKLNGKKVEVTGIIDLSNKGHLNSYFCTLSSISCIKEK